MNSISLLPLTISQKRALHPRAIGNASIHLRGKLSMPALCRALAFIMKRHEVLRTRVVHSNGEPQQRIVAPIDSYEIQVIPAESLAAAEERIKSYLSSPADLENDGPLRAELMRIAEDDHVLLLVIHVIAMDAHSWGLLTRELLISYESFTRDQEPSLPPAMNYSDYVLNEARYGEKMSDAVVQYWRSVLSGSRHPIPAREGFTGRSTLKVKVASITTMETKRLQEFASAVNVSMTVALYSIILLSVSSQYSIDDVLASVGYTGRDSRLLETLCGRTARRFPLRVIMNEKMSVVELAHEVQTAFLTGAIASRAPFNFDRTIAPSIDEPRAMTAGAGAKASAHQGISLWLNDDMKADLELGLTISNLSAKRILLDPRLIDGTEVEVAAPTPPAFFVGLSRWLDIKAGRPVSFCATFLQSFMSEGEVSQLLAKMCDMARLTTRENRKLAIGELVRMTSQRIP